MQAVRLTGSEFDPVSVTLDQQSRHSGDLLGQHWFTALEST